MHTQRPPSLLPLVPLLTLLAVAAGCSGKPTEADGEAAVREQIAREAEGRIQLNAFRKTNGVEGVRDGTPIYTLEYQADLEFLAECKWLTNADDTHDGFKTAQTDEQAQEKKGFWRGLATAVLEPGTEQKKGEKVTYDGKLVFEKAEKGWRPVPPAEE